MATKYWYVAGNGSANWNTANWYPNSGGVGGGASTLPVTDDAVLDANSGTGTLTLTTIGASTCNSFDATTFSGSLAGDNNLTIVNTTANRTSSAFPLFAFGAAMTQSLTGTTTFSASGAGIGGYIYCNGQSFKGNVNFNSTTSTFYLLDTFRTLPTNQVTFTNGTVLDESNEGVYVGKIDTNTGTKTVNINQLYLTGTGTLTSTVSPTGLTTSISELFIIDSSSLSKTLTLVANFSPSNIYITGSGAGSYTIDLDSTSVQSTIYVEQTGNSSISFLTGQIGGLYFLPETNINWNNATGQTLSLGGDLILTGSMTASRTPNLVFNGGGNITLASKPLTVGTTFIVNNNSIYYLTDGFNNNIAVSVLANSKLYTKDFRTTSALTLTDSSIDVQLLSPASGSGTISTAAVDSQRYSLVTPIPQNETTQFIASSNPVPTFNYQLREFYFSTGSTATATVTNLASKINSANTGFLIPIASGTTLILSASSNGTTYNGTTFSTGSITGQFPKTPLFTLGGGSATTRATGSGIIVNAAVDGQRYNIVTPANIIYSFIASSTPLPTDSPSSPAYFFSTGSTPIATAANLTSRINDAANIGYIASSSGTTLIISASTNLGKYQNAVFLTGSLPGRKPDYSLFSLNSPRSTTFSVGSLTTYDSTLYLYATENTCSGNWSAEGSFVTFLYGRDIYIGGNISLPDIDQFLYFYTDNLYVNGTISNGSTNQSIDFFSTGTNTLANTVTLTGESGLNLANPNVTFSNITVTNGSIGGNGGILRCTGLLTITRGNISITNAYAGNITITGTIEKNIIISNLYLTGTGSLYNPGTSTNVIASVNNIYITNNSAGSKTLTLNSTFPSDSAISPIISLEGSGSGPYTITPSTTVTTPNIRVSNTGGADISIGTGLLTGLSFISSSNVNWNNVAGQGITIEGNLLLTSSMTTQVTPNLNLVNSTALELADQEFKTGSFTLNTTTSPIYITGSLKSNAAVSINNSKVTASNYVSCSTLSLSNTASISCSNNMYIDSLAASGTARKEISAQELYVLGGSSLPTTVPTNLTSSFNTIYYLGDSSTARSITFTGSFGAPTLYIDGDTLAGPITASLSTVYRPDVYVTNTGGSPISFSTSTLSSLSFISSSNVNWNNVVGQTLTISRSLELTSSMTTTATPNLLLSGSGFNSLILANEPLNVGSVTINTPNIINISGSLLGSAAVTLTSSSVFIQNNYSSSGLLTINGGSRLTPTSSFFAGSVSIASGSINLGSTTTNIISQSLTLITGSISASGDLSVGTLIATGAGPKSLNTPNLSFTGTGLLYSPGTNFTVTPTLSSISVTGSATAARGLILTDNLLTSSLIYLGGNGSGLITASFGSIFKPDVYVTNTGSAQVSFLTSTISSLSFISSSNANWDNIAGQTLTISKSLALTSSMATNATPNLLLSGSSFNFLALADQDLRTGTLTINTTNPLSVSGNLTTNAAVTITSSSVSVQNNFSSSGLVTMNGGGRLTQSGSIFFAGSVSIASGSIILRGTTNTVSQSLTLITGSISSSGDLSVGNLVTTGAAIKTLSTPNLSFTGTGLLYTTGTNLTISSPINSISVTGSATAARGLILTDNRLTSSLIYLGGNGSGLITGSFGTNSRPNVYVTNTGGASISLLTSTISSLSFISSSTANWNNIAGQTITISGSLVLTSSMATNATPNLILSGSGFNSLVLADQDLRTGTLTINTPNTLNVSGSLVTNAAVTIRSSSVLIQTNFSGSTLTLDNGSVTASNTIFIGPLFTSGTLSKKLISDTLYYTGTSSLPFPSATNLTSSMNTLHFDGSTNISRSITYDNQFKPSTIYIGGALSGSITASFGTSSIPTVYVDNTSTTPITFSSASISSLTFLSGSRVNWNTSGSQTLTISGSLTLTGSMTASRTPNLVFNGNSNITLAGKNLSGSLISQAPFTQSFLDNFSSSGSVVVNGFLSASNITITRVDSLNVLGNCNISSSAIGTTIITGTGSVWSIPSTSIVNIPNNVIRIVNTTNNAVTFSGGTNEIYGDLTFARGASTADNLISGSNTFVNLRDTGTAAHTMSLATGSTQTVGTFDVKGTPGNVVTVKSTTGIATLYKDPLGLVMSNYLSVNGVTATSGSGPWTWFAGPNSTLVNAAGWLTTGSEGVSIVRRLGSQGVG